MCSKVVTFAAEETCRRLEAQARCSAAARQVARHPSRQASSSNSLSLIIDHNPSAACSSASTSTGSRAAATSCRARR